MLALLAHIGYRGESLDVSSWRVLSWVPRWLLPTEDGALFALVFFAVCLSALRTTARGWWLARFRPLQVSVLLAVITAWLGFWSYLPTATTEKKPDDPITHWVMLGAWVLDLFMGVLPESPGKVTGHFANLAFQIAVFSGLATVTSAAASIILHLLRRQSDRLRAVFDIDIDIVIGVDEQALDLARQLKKERDDLPAFPLWYRVGWWERLKFWCRNRRSSVVVLHNNPQDPRLGEFRALGCRVVVRDSWDDLTLNKLVFTLGRPALRRMFAVLERPADNRALSTRVASILSRTSGTRPGPFVPRIIALVRDPREARALRLDNLNTPGYYMDALSIDELLARDIVTRIAQAGRSTVVLLGDSALTLAILDEIVLRRAFSHECRSKKNSLVTDEFPISTAILVDPHAKAQVDEWVQHRPPAACRPTEFTPQADTQPDWDTACDTYLGVDPDGQERSGCDAAVVVTGTPTAQLTAQALRLSGRHEHTLVFCPDARTSGVEDLPEGADIHGRWVISYGPSLLQNGQVPEDSWVVLARQNHDAFLADKEDRDRAARCEWADASVPEFDSRARNRSDRRESVVAVDDTSHGRLPRFFRDDNLGQQRQLMRMVASGELGHPGWVPVTSRDLRTQLEGASLTDALLHPKAVSLIAKAEHERWCRKRVDNGWTWADPAHVLEADKAKRTQEWHRRSPNMWEWDNGTEEDQEYDLQLIRDLLNRLFLYGIAPAPRVTHDNVTRAELEKEQ